MIEVEGFDEVIVALEKLSDTDGIKRAMGKACAVVEKAAKQKAPKDSGELRRLIQSEVEDKGTTINGVIFNPLEYAPYVEYGTGLFAEKGGRKDVPWAYEDEKTGELIWTSGQKPHPYMRPALNENKQQIIKMIKEALIK